MLAMIRLVFIQFQNILELQMGVKLYCSHDQAPFIVITLKNNKATLNECRVYYDSDWRIDGRAVCLFKSMISRDERVH